jgi:hypothetical protein
MTKEETEALQKAALEKAHSAGTIIGRMGKAVTSFHKTMGDLHKAHHDDMHKAFGQLTKVLGTGPGEQESNGVAPGSSEPVGVGLVPDGATSNLQDFGKLAPADQQKALDAMILKGVEAVLTKVLTPEGGDCPACSGDMTSCACTKAQIAKAASDKLNKTVETPVVEPVAKVAPGIGDRKTVPVARVVSPAMGKAFDQPGNSGQPVTEHTEAEMSVLVQKAASGDQNAQLELMKGSKPTEIPSTLIEPLSKIH